MARNRVWKLLAVLALLVFMTFSLTACTEEKTAAEKNVEDIYKGVDKEAKERSSYIPKHDWDYVNYDRAYKEVWDNPTSILWCTFSFNNPSSPLVTVPVQTKLTSSSVSIRENTRAYFDSNSDGENYSPEVRSVDGMFHGSPPPYRYGFTPGGQYVDFFNTETFCTTAPTEFQRQQTNVSLSIDNGLQSASEEAEKALAENNEAEAQRILNNAIGGG